jgi:hypothetical protein
VQSTGKSNNNANVNKLKTSNLDVENISKEVQKCTMGARATDSARVMKFTKVLSGTTIILGIVIFKFLFSICHPFPFLVMDMLGVHILEYNGSSGRC